MDDKILQHLTKKLLKRFDVEYVDEKDFNFSKYTHFVQSLRRCYISSVNTFSLRFGEFDSDCSVHGFYSITKGHIRTDLFYFNNYLKNFYNG